MQCDADQQLACPVCNCNLQDEADPRQHVTECIESMMGATQLSEGDEEDEEDDVACTVCVVCRCLNPCSQGVPHASA